MSNNNKTLLDKYNKLTQVIKNEDPVSLALGYSHSLMLLGYKFIYLF